MKKAFTLIEMVLVLAVIALLTHLAVRELSAFRESRMIESADRQLREIRDAVWSVDADGVPHGFLNDTGMLLRDLQELVVRPDDIPPYGIANVATNAGEKVYVSTGWRGPYVRLSSGRRKLLDVWGNEFGTSVDAGGAITNIYHLGPSGQLRTRSRDCALCPSNGTRSRIPLLMDDGSETTVACYGPAATGRVETVACTLPNVVEFSSPGIKVISGAGKMRVLNVMPGDNPPKALK